MLFFDSFEKLSIKLKEKKVNLGTVSPKYSSTVFNINFVYDKSDLCFNFFEAKTLEYRFFFVLCIL